MIANSGADKYTKFTRDKEERKMLSLIWAVSWRAAIFFGICYAAVEYINYMERKEAEYGDEE